MPNLGAPEIILIVVAVVLIFGARRLPEIARSLGRSKGEFKKGLEENDSAGGDAGSAGKSDKTNPAGQ